MWSMGDKGNPTIFDVARLAGVARGTVDRVVYNRGGVSEKTAGKVRDAIAKLGYSANPVAARLASKKRYTIACLIPEAGPGDYWDVVKDGFFQAAEADRSHSVSVSLHRFDTDSLESYREACREVLESRPSGVVMNVVFEDELRLFTAELLKQGIPYAFVDRKVDDLPYTVYCGADPWDAGYLGAYLLTHRQQVGDIAFVRIRRKSPADPNKLRRDGFMRYLRDHLPGCRVSTVFIPPENPDEALNILEDFCRKHPEIKHFTMANSRVHLMVPFLRMHPDPERSVVGYDDLQRNLDAVREGLVEYLVTRRSPMQAYNVVSLFAESLIAGKAPQRRDHYMHMDILSRLNLKDYEL